MSAPHELEVFLWVGAGEFGSDVVMAENYYGPLADRAMRFVRRNWHHIHSKHPSTPTSLPDGARLWDIMGLLCPLGEIIKVMHLEGNFPAHPCLTAVKEKEGECE